MRRKASMLPEVDAELRELGRRGAELCNETLERMHALDVLDHVYNSDYVPCRGRLKNAKVAFERLAEGRKF